MTATLIKASAHNTELPDKSCHMICTSPPYFGLRDYDGDQAIDWPSVEYAPMPGLPTITIPPMTCGLGAEPTPEAYIGHMVLVMREMWRVLRDDGTCWVNLGDSFAHNRPGGQPSPTNTGNRKGYEASGTQGVMSVPADLRAKSKMLIPHRFALAMQAEGWIVRQDNVWAKGISFQPDYAGKCMPYSGQDNTTPSHEYIFLMTKQGRYYYDNVAVAEKSNENQRIHNEKYAKNYEAYDSRGGPNGTGQPGNENNRGIHSRPSTNGTRNLRSVWVINPGSYPGAHFATFAPKLPEVCILASTSAKGVCPECGAQWRRVVERTAATPGQKPGYIAGTQTRNDGDRAGSWTDHKATTTGWDPTCTCDAGEPVPATVLDPFNGSGTTGMVAVQHNRHYIGIDLSDEYFEQTNARLSATQPMLPGILA